MRLAWRPARDHRIGVTGYQVFRDGRWVTGVFGTEYIDSGLASDTVYVYFVHAWDRAGNLSATSSAVMVVTS